MSFKGFVRVSVLASVAWLAVSCASTTSQVTDSRTRFSERASASVVLRYYSWDYIFVTQPAYRENGFYSQVKRENLVQALTKLGVRHDMAVVIVGWNYSNEQLAQLIGDWKSILGTQGFQRVVFVRAGETDEVNGCLVIDDAQKPFGPKVQSARL